MLKNIISLVAGLIVGLICVNVVRAEMDEKQFEQLFEKYINSPKGQEKLVGALEQAMKKRQEQSRKQQEDMMAAQMEEQFKNPVKVEVGKSPVKGPTDAKVTIIEFSDFQCPYCQRANNTVSEILKAYPKDVKVAFKHLPLPFHQNAMPAAKASLAAGEQGKFWEMHDSLFQNQTQLSDELFIKEAQRLGLDVEKFKKDMASPEIEKQIKDDMDLAKKHGIEGTPGFFVNGVAVKGAYPIDHFKKIIDRWIAGAPSGTTKKS